MIFFHGGGFVTGNINSYSRVCTRMANRTKHIILSVDYRLAPEHPFPVGLEDCYAVVKEVINSTLLFNHPIHKITLIGDSAGANLAAAVSLLARDRGSFRLIGRFYFIRLLIVITVMLHRILLLRRMEVTIY